MTSGSIAPFVIIIVLPTLAWVLFILIPTIRARISIKRGLADSARGDVHDLGSFAYFSTDKKED